MYYFNNGFAYEHYKKKNTIINIYIKYYTIYNMCVCIYNHMDVRV